MLKLRFIGLRPDKPQMMCAQGRNEVRLGEMMLPRWGK